MAIFEIFNKNRCGFVCYTLICEVINDNLYDDLVISDEERQVSLIGFILGPKSMCQNMPDRHGVCDLKFPTFCRNFRRRCY